jgi:hypothetical protein
LPKAFDLGLGVDERRHVTGDTSWGFDRHALQDASRFASTQHFSTS